MLDFREAFSPRKRVQRENGCYQRLYDLMNTKNLLRLVSRRPSTLENVARRSRRRVLPRHPG